MNSIASLSARSSMPRSGSYRTTSTNGSKVTTRKDRIKAAGVSARRRRKHSLTPSPLRGKKRSLPDHHQQRTGHLQKGTVCKIKYKLLHLVDQPVAQLGALQPLTDQPDLVFDLTLLPARCRSAGDRL